MIQHVASRLLVVFLACWIGMYARPTDAAGPSIEIVTGPSAPDLEGVAASELAGQLRLLFEAEVKTVPTLSPEAANVILIGSPATNPVVKAAVGDQFPQVSDQGQVIKSVTYNKRNVLIVGGGSPAATLWAVYELVHRFGIRTFPNYDVMPVTVPQLKLDGFDLVIEPTFRMRAFQMLGDQPISTLSWGVADRDKLIGQLAQWKYNQLMIVVKPWQPFVNWEFQGTAKSGGKVWTTRRLPVDRDTAGRVAFRGAKEFTNPSLTVKEKSDDLAKLGHDYLSGLINSAHDRGMSVTLALDPLSFPAEFKKVLPDHVVLPMSDASAIGPGSKVAADDSLLMQLATAQLKAYLKAYPDIDSISLQMPQSVVGSRDADHAWKLMQSLKDQSDLPELAPLLKAVAVRSFGPHGESGVELVKSHVFALSFLKQLLAQEDFAAARRDRKLQISFAGLDPVFLPYWSKLLPGDSTGLLVVDQTLGRIAKQVDSITTEKTAETSFVMALPFGDNQTGVLPNLAFAPLHQIVTALHKNSVPGYCVSAYSLGELGAEFHYLARASQTRAANDPEQTPTALLEDLVLPICGPGVADRLAKAFGYIEHATQLIDQADANFGYPVPDLFTRQATADPLPEWWDKARTDYLEAMNEMYRANTRIRDNVNARAFSLYIARRCESAFEFMNSLESVRLASQALAKGDLKGQSMQLEKATESIFNSLSAYADISVDNCDRAIIAILNEYGYRVLLANLLEAQEKAEENAENDRK